jgi:MraZ protein
VTRKTQIGLLTATCVVCCVAVFLGARLSNRGHAASDGSSAAPTETPAAPTPAPEVCHAPEPSHLTEPPRILANIEPAPLPPADPPLPPMDEVKPDPKPADAVPLPPLPTDVSGKADVKTPEVALTGVRAPDEDLKANDFPPPPPPASPTGDVLPQPASKKATDKPMLPEPKLTGREVTEKSPSPTPADAPPRPMPTATVPPPSDGAAAQAIPPVSPDPATRPQSPEKPRATTTEDPGPYSSHAAEPAVESLPPARVVPVSPTTPSVATPPLMPVLKKPAGAKKAMPMTGTHVCKMDDQHGVTLPKAVREQLSEHETLFVTLGSDHCIWLTTATGLEKLTDRLEKQPADSDEDPKVTRRRYLAQTERIGVDKNGRCVMPTALVESVGLKQDAVLIGVGDHFELWDVQSWHKYSQTPGAEPANTPAADSHEEF